MTSVILIEQELNPNAWKFQILKAVIFCCVWHILSRLSLLSTLNLGAYLVAFLLLFVSIAALFSGFAAFGEPKTTWWMIVLGIIGIIIAAYSFLNPAFMITFGTICVGIIALLSGLTDIILAFGKGLSAGIRILTFILGVLTLLIGLIFLLKPGIGAELLVLLVGIFLIIGGIVALVEGIMFKKFMSEVTN